VKTIKPHILFFSINSISAIPVFRLILKGLDASLFSGITICECYLEDMSARFDMPYKHIDMLYFKSAKHFNAQTVKEKVSKYFLSLRYLWKGTTDNAIVYTSDVETLALAILIRKLKRVCCRIVYHQFEAIEKERANSLKKLSLNFIRRCKGVDLAVFPEQNRLELFKSIVCDTELRTFLFPNTCYPKVRNAVDQNTSGKIRIGHVGALSSEAFYLDEFLDAAKAAHDGNVEYFFVGVRNEELKSRILKALPQAEVIGWTDHAALENIYHSFHIGLILYKPLDFNTAYCAPNKLYEYWSFGIPVWAPDLPGLIPVFDTVLKGKLIDFTQPSALSLVMGDLSPYQRMRKEELMQLFGETLSVTVFIGRLEENIKLLF
jgi:hypothetical protein